MADYGERPEVCGERAVNGEGLMELGSRNKTNRIQLVRRKTGDVYRLDRRCIVGVLEKWKRKREDQAELGGHLIVYEGTGAFRIRRGCQLR